MIVRATCQTCHDDIALGINDFALPERTGSIDFDTPEFRRKLEARGWTLPGPYCPACNPSQLPRPPIEVKPMEKKRYDSTLARMAGNLLSGDSASWMGVDDKARRWAVREAVLTAEAIVEECELLATFRANQDADAVARDVE